MGKQLFVERIIKSGLTYSRAGKIFICIHFGNNTVVHFNFYIVKF